MTDGRIFPGFRAIGRKINTNHHVAKKIVEQLGINVSMKKVPKISSKQESTINERLPLLACELNFRLAILDDETYFDLNGHDFYGGQFYSYHGSSKDVNGHVKCRFKEKFGNKLLVWAGISEEGISDIYFHLSNGAINSDAYIEECIKKRLVKFINKHDKKRKYSG